ncbi:ubiquitin-protein transferase [Aureococcus anophagefferens]|nr:ubiquitin-protein transferase [Aureococcus anophagefferens]
MGNARFLDMMQRTGNNRTTYRPRLSLGPKPARARGGPAAPATQESRRVPRRRGPAGAPRKESVRSRITRRIQTVYTRAEAGRAPRRSDAGAGAASESDGESSSSARARRPRRDPDLYAGAAVTARPLYAVDASVLRRPEAPAARAADEVHAAKLRLVVAKKKAADARRHGRDVLDVSPYVAGPPGKGHAGNPAARGLLL